MNGRSTISIVRRDRWATWIGLTSRTRFDITEDRCKPSWTFIVSLIVWYILKLIIGIRVSEEEEYEGVDIGECGLEAYPEFTSAE